MNLEALKALAMSKIARQVLVTQKHSPKILFVAGTVGVIGTVVLACRATLQVGEILDNHEIDAKLIKGEFPATQLASDDAAKELNKLKVKTAIQIAKPYLLPVGLGIVSIGALTGSHIILTKRNTAVMAAYAAMQKSYDEYRRRVATEYGADVDRKMTGGYETIEVNEKMADGTNKTAVKVVPSTNGSPYAALFDEKSKHYTRMPGMNANVLGMIQSHANDKLRARGHLFLNEVYDMLDLPRKPAGQIVGWVFNSDPNNVDHAGDNYVTFGIWENDDEFVESFMDGHEKTIWLDFNVDGPVYERI
jgi:uncharacterized protein (UPF0297 family)